MKKLYLIIIVILIFLVGCNNNQTINNKDNIINNDTTEENINNIKPKVYNENNEPNDWVVIDIAEGNGAYYKSILINLNDIKNKDYQLIEINDILSYFEDTILSEFRHNSNDPEFISIDGFMFQLYNFDSRKDIILDLKNEKLITEQDEIKSNLKNFYMLFYYKDSKHYLNYENFNNGNDIKFYNYDNELITGPQISYDNKKTVSVEKDKDGLYYLVFYNLEEELIYDRVHIDEINTDDISFSQWHWNNNIYFNIGYNAYSYNVETKEVVEIGKYLFNIMMSYDEKFLVYNKPTYLNKQLMTELEGYGETGFFVLDLATNEEYKLKGDIFNKYEINDLYLYLSRIIHTNVNYSDYVNPISTK